MEYRFLGKSGLKVSELDLGTQTFGWGADEKTAHTMLDRFVDAGGNIIDSANIYNLGRSEQYLGSWLKKSPIRDQLIICTKVFFPSGQGPNDTGLTRKHIFNEIDRSLRRLNTDYVDLYQLHCFDSSTPLEETLSALSALVDSGKVRYIGASNFTPSQLEKALMISKMQGFQSFASLQPEYSLIVRSTEWELCLKLLEQKPELYEWRHLSMEDFKNAMGGRNYRGREKLIAELQKLSVNFHSTPPAVSLMIKNAAQTILQIKRQLNEIKKMMGELTAENPAVKALEQIKGISVITSSTLMAEIIDIRRFANDDHLASYVGLGRSEYSSEDRKKLIPNPQFNHRLKDVFITAAKNFVNNNPDSHLSGYFRNLVRKRRMKPNGSYVRSDQGHESNISLSAPTENDKEREVKIKREKRDRKRRKMVSVEKIT